MGQAACGLRTFDTCAGLNIPNARPDQLSPAHASKVKQLKELDVLVRLTGSGLAFKGSEAHKDSGVSI